MMMTRMQRCRPRNQNIGARLVARGWLLLVASSLSWSLFVAAFSPVSTSSLTSATSAARRWKEQQSLTLYVSFDATRTNDKVDITEGTERDIYSMEEWAAACGVQRIDGLQLVCTVQDQEDHHHFQNAGIIMEDDYSVMTQQNLEASSPVMFVPNEVLLTSYQVVEEFGTETLKPAEDALSEAVQEYNESQTVDEMLALFRLFVKILVEYQKGMESPWFPWLNSLPRRFNNGASMTYACFECLLPYAAELSMTQRENANAFAKSAKLLQYAGVLQESTTVNADLLKWAYSVAATRSIDIPNTNNQLAIPPLADYFNHGAQPTVVHNFDENGNLLVHTTGDVPAGSALHMSLGNPTNPSPLLATYGFLDDSSPATFCKIMDKPAEMDELNLQKSDLIFYKDSGDISPAVWDLMLYSILKENNEDDAAQAFFDAFMAADEDTKNQYHQAYFQYTVQALRQHVNDTLQALGELSQQAQSKDPTTHPRIPIILHHNDFVRQAFLQVQANLDNLRV